MDNIGNNSNIVEIDLINRIKKELVDKSYYNDIKFNLKWKSYWKVIADVSETLAQILIGISAVLAFASGFFEYTLLSFIAGCFGTASLVLYKFSSYSMGESKERTAQVNL